MNISTIREKLRRGDYLIIASLTGYNVRTVRMQINGQRTLKDRVRDAAIKVINNREELLQSSTQPLTK